MASILLVPRKQSQEKKSLKKNVRKFSLLKLPLPLQTCREDHLLGDEFIIYNGELRKLDLRHPGDCVIVATPVKLYVISCVSICKRKHT